MDNGQWTMDNEVLLPDAFVGRGFTPAAIDSVVIARIGAAVRGVNF